MAGPTSDVLDLGRFVLSQGLSLEGFTGILPDSILATIL